MSAVTDRVNRTIDRIRGVDPRAIDGLLALLFTVIAGWTVAGRVGDNEPYRADDALAIILVFLQTLPLAARRAAPLAALTVNVAAISIHIGIGYEGVPIGTFAALVLIYTLTSVADTTQSVIGAVLTATGLLIYFVADRGEPGIAQAVSTSAIYAIGWGLGFYARSRREYTTVMEERAALLERDREVTARAAVADERARIARELHDMVGHALNLIVIQSGGAQRVFHSKPEAARDALASIEATGRHALTDMERMLGMLSATAEPGDALSPQPGLADVQQLAATVSEAGLPVDVQVQGTPVDLPPSVDLSAYRIIQEALTNALKHAGPARAAVRILYAADAIELDITDDGRAVADEDPARTGRGIIGMRERAGLYGGELEAGPRPEGGFRVHATIPVAGARS